MPRLINFTKRSDVPENLQKTYDTVAALRNGAVSGPYGILLHSPDLAVSGAALGKYLRWNSALTPSQREIAILTVAQILEAKVMWSAHVRLARDAGVREEVIDTIAHSADLTKLTSEESQIIRYVDELFNNNKIRNATIDSLHRRLGDQGIVDITGLVGYYAFVGATLNAFELEPLNDPT